MKVTNEMRRNWELRIPELGGKYTHWWLDGDGGVIIVTDDLKELLDAATNHHGKSLKIEVLRAYHNEDGDCIADTKFSYKLSDYVDDKIFKEKRNKTN